MDRAVAAFDIETVPDVDVGRRVWGLQGDFLSVAEGMFKKRLEETDDRTDFLKAPYHRVVAISVAWYDPRSEQFKLDSLGGGDYTDEGALLDGFFRILHHKPLPRLVSWHGSGFDMPVLAYRAMVHGCDAGAYWFGQEGNFNRYPNRYHDLHTDLMDVLSHYGASDRVGLDDLCRLFGLPGKTVTEGHRVYQHVARGEWELVQTYCQLDALNTLMLYLAFALSRRAPLATPGRMAQFGPAEFAAARARIAAAVAADPRPEVAAYGREIADWMPGRSRRALAEELA